MDAMIRQMLDDGADSQYLGVVKKDGFYAARISLKAASSDLVALFVGEIGPRDVRWNRFIAAHDEIATIGTLLG